MATKKIKISELKKIIKEELERTMDEGNWNMQQDSQKLADVLGTVAGAFSVNGEVELGGRVLNPQRKYALVPGQQGKLKIYDYGSALVGAKQWLGDTTEAELQQLEKAGKITVTR